MISDEDLKDATPMAPNKFQYSQSTKTVSDIIERLRSAEKALQFYAPGNWLAVEVWDYSLLVDRGDRALAHFEKVKNDK